MGLASVVGGEGSGWAAEEGWSGRGLTIKLFAEARPLQLDFLHGKQNVILLGPPGTGKTHIATALVIRACLAAQRVQFATATQTGRQTE